MPSFNCFENDSGKEPFAVTLMEEPAPTHPLLRRFRVGCHRAVLHTVPSLSLSPSFVAHQSSQTVSYMICRSRFSSWNSSFQSFNRCLRRTSKIVHCLLKLVSLTKHLLVFLTSLQDIYVLSVSFQFCQPPSLSWIPCSVIIAPCRASFPSFAEPAQEDLKAYLEPFLENREPLHVSFSFRS